MGQGVRMLAPASLSAVLAVIAVFLAPAAYALTLNLSPVSDREAWDNDLDGVVETLRDEWYPPETLCCPNELHVAKDASPSFEPGTSRAALEFELGPPLSRPRIVSATLYLQIAGAFSLATELDQFQIRVHSFAGDGTVSLADMLIVSPLIAPTYWNQYLGPATPDWPYHFALDVKPALLALNPSERYLGLMLEGVSPSGGFSFFSKETAFGRGPLLQIRVAVPESGTLMLLGTGLLGLAIARRRSACTLSEDACV